jgi:hypothetical protein
MLALRGPELVVLLVPLVFAVVVIAAGVALGRRL